jgi:hypothetical protein
VQIGSNTNPSESVVWMLEEGDPSSMEQVVCTSRTRIVVNIVHCGSCKQATIELRRANSFFYFIVMIYLFSKFCGHVQYPVKQGVYKGLFAGFRVDHDAQVDGQWCLSVLTVPTGRPTRGSDLLLTYQTVEHE